MVLIKHFLLTVMLLNICVETFALSFFKILLMNRKFKRTAFIKNKNLKLTSSWIQHISTVIFDLFNALLLK